MEHKESQVIWQDKEHQFIWLGMGDPDKEKGIGSNQYMVVDREEAYILDPGGYHVFDRVFNNVLKFVPLDRIKGLFLSHQDPDICASLISWLEARPNVQVIISGLWTRFISHLALPVDPKLYSLPDEGGEITLPSGGSLRFIPAHFLHSCGNFHVYDSRSRTLFTGDLGAAIIPDKEWTLFVGDFDKHIPMMEGFHRRYMSSTRALRAYLDRLQGLEIDYICPQHGAIFQKNNAKRFLEWLSGLEVGVDYKQWGDKV